MPPPSFFVCPTTFLKPLHLLSPSSPSPRSYLIRALPVPPPFPPSYFLTLYFILGGVSIACQLLRAVMTITGSITAR